MSPCLSLLTRPGNIDVVLARRGLYTVRAVRRFISYVTFVVVLAVGGLPAAQLACEWSCAPEAAGSHQHGHGHGSAAPEQAGGDVTVKGLATGCEHLDATTPALGSGSFKLDPDVTLAGFAAAPGPDAWAIPLALLSPADGPPGPSSPPLVLRL